MPTVVQDVSGDSALQTAIAALKAKIEGAEESSDIAQVVSQINTALGNKQDKLTFDNTPTAGSTKPVTSGGVKMALDSVDTEIGELKENLNNIAITKTDDGKYAFDDVLSPATIDYIYSATAFGNARYANKRNYMPEVSLDTIENDAHISVVDRTIIVTGTPSQSSSLYAIDALLPVIAPAGDYVFHFEVDKGSSSILYGQNIIVRADYVDNTSANLFTQLVKDTNVTVEKTIAKDVKKIRVEFYYTAKNTYNNHRVWIGMYPADTVFTDIGEPIAEQTVTSISLDNITDPSVIDTVQHKSNCTYLVDTKTYVDNHMPDDVITKSELAYLSPEMFGAYGDGSHDDTQAILNCVSASRIDQYKALPIRGYNTYKISSPIEFSGRNNNVYIHNISYIGSDAAVILHGMQSNFEFDNIEAIANGSPVGIRITTTQNEGFSANTVKCNRIFARGNCVEFINATQNVIYYGTFTFCFQSTIDGNIFYINGNDINEIDLYGKVIYASNGYFIYDANEVPQSIIRAHNFCIESGLKYGMNSRIVLCECRTDEFFIKPGSSEDPKAGVLFDFSQKVPHGGVLSDSVTKISYESVSVNNAMSYQDTLSYVGSHFSDASDTERFTMYVRFLIPIFPKFEFMSQYMLPLPVRCSMILYYNHKAVKPDGEWYYKVASDFNAGINGMDYIAPTFFDIDGTSVKIYLDFSYCYLAINNFKLQQYENKKAIVYDKFGNLLFDGTNKDAGVYEFECEFVKHDPIALDLGNGETYTYNDYYSSRVYDGTNEKWTICKKNVVT